MQRIVNFIGVMTFVMLHFFLAIFFFTDLSISQIDFAKTFKILFGVSILLYPIIMWAGCINIMRVMYNNISINIPQLENNLPFIYSDRSDHWNELHDLMSKKVINMQGLKYYKGQYTFLTEHTERLVYDTFWPMVNLYRELELFVAVYPKINKTNRPAMLYDTQLFERKPIVKARWEFYLNNLDKYSEEYDALLKKYNKKFPKKSKKQHDQNDRVTPNHLNDDLMGE